MAVATGLTPREDKQLRRRLAQIGAVRAKLAYLGGSEAREMFSLEARIRARTDPPDAAALDAEAEVLMTTFVQTCDGLRAALDGI